MRALVLALLAFPATARAGGWTQEEGEYYLKIWNRTMVGQIAYTADALRHGERIPRYQDYQLNAYAEIGIHERVTWIGSMTPIGWASIDGRSTTYAGPLITGTRIGLVRGNTPFAIQLSYGYAPRFGTEVLYDPRDVGERERRIIYQAAIENHLGEVQLQLGHSYRARNTSAWLSASLGVRLNSAFEHALTGLVQLGFSRRVDWDIHVTFYEPMFQTIEATNASGVGDTRYLGIGVGVTYMLNEHIGINASVDGVFYAGSNAGTPALTLGIERR